MPSYITLTEEVDEMVHGEVSLEMEHMEMVEIDLEGTSPDDEIEGPCSSPRNKGS